MLRFDPPETSDAAAQAVSTLTSAAWVLAALVDVLGRSSDRQFGSDDLAAGVLAASGLMIATDGGYAPAPGLASLMDQGGAAAVEGARSVIGQVATVAKGLDVAHSWTEQDDDTLLAQGRSSGVGVTQMLPLLFATEPALKERLHRPGARFLDVGVGVGALACAMAEAIPSLSVVGVDPWERVLSLASRLLAEHGLDDRVTVRAMGVEELDDEDAFDLAWIPAPFVPPPAFASGIPRLYRALRPGGWILVAMGRFEGDPVSTAITRWQTALIGGTPLTVAETTTLLTGAGFREASRIETPPGRPVLVLARKPS